MRTAEKLGGQVLDQYPTMLHNVWICRVLHKSYFQVANRFCAKDDVKWPKEMPQRRTRWNLTINIEKHAPIKVVAAIEPRVLLQPPTQGNGKIFGHVLVVERRLNHENTRCEGDDGFNVGQPRLRRIVAKVLLAKRTDEPGLLLPISWKALQALEREKGVNTKHANRRRNKRTWTSLRSASSKSKPRKSHEYATNASS